MRENKLFWIVVTGLMGSAPVFGSLIVDGNLSDWGVSVADNNHSTYNFTPGIGLLGSMIEDQNDRADGDSYLGPERGGQKYDAEMMAVAYQNGRIHMAIVTGQRPSNGLSRFAPGDIRIEASGHIYGIEVGGGAGGGMGSSIVAGTSGSTYTLNSHGYTTAANNADSAQTAGSIWSNVSWINSTVLPKPTQFQINGSSSHVGDATYYYTRNSSTSQHAIIELSFDGSILGTGSQASFHWRPSCDNDELDVNTSWPTPEPATLILLLGSGMFFRRR